jgi:hypothetical protein
MWVLWPYPPSPASSVAVRSYPALAVVQLDLPEKTETYEIIRRQAQAWQLRCRRHIGRVSGLVTGAENPRLRGAI